MSHDVPIRPAEAPLFTVLFVDDSRNIRDFCRKELERDGYRVLEAPDGQAALEICGRQRPDVLVVDVHMPLLNGVETVQRVHGVYPDLPVIFFTSQRGEVPAAPSPKAVWKCVEKTPDLGELKSSIARVLEDSPPPSPDRR